MIDPVADSELDAALRSLSGVGLRYERVEAGAYLVTLEGEARPTTSVWLVLGRHGLQVDALFLRRPERNADVVHGWLLRRNARTWGVHFATDELGDVWLTGIVPLAAVTAADVDRVLGQVHTHVEEVFRAAAEAGFALGSPPGPGATDGRQDTPEPKVHADGSGRRPTVPRGPDPAYDARR